MPKSPHSRMDGAWASVEGGAGITNTTSGHRQGPAVGQRRATDGRTLVLCDESNAPNVGRQVADATRMPRGQPSEARAPAQLSAAKAGAEAPQGDPLESGDRTPYEKVKKYGSLYWERGVGDPHRGRGRGQGHGPARDGRWWGHYLQAASYPAVGSGGQGHRATAGSGVDPRGALRHRHGLGASGLIPCASGVHPDRDGGRVRAGCGIATTDSAYLVS